MSQLFKKFHQSSKGIKALKNMWKFLVCEVTCAIQQKTLKAQTICKNSILKVLWNLEVRQKGTHLFCSIRCFTLKLKSDFSKNQEIYALNTAMKKTLNLNFYSLNGPKGCISFDVQQTFQLHIYIRIWIAYFRSVCSYWYIWRPRGGE